MSTVNWQLGEVPGGTHLSLVHQRLPDNTSGLLQTFDRDWDMHIARLIKATLR